MKKTILSMFVVLIALFAVACGGNNSAKGGNGAGNTAGGDGSSTVAADPYELYKKKGRTWTHKNDFGGNVSHMKVEVIDVKDDHAMIKTWMLDKDKKPMAGMPEPEATKMEFKKVEAPKDAAPKDGPKVETKDETVEAAGQKWETTWTKVGDNESWMSKKYPGLIIKNKSAAGTMELVEFKE